MCFTPGPMWAPQVAAAGTVDNSSAYCPAPPQCPQPTAFPALCLLSADPKPQVWGTKNAKCFLHPWGWEGRTKASAWCPERDDSEEQSSLELRGYQQDEAPVAPRASLHWLFTLHPPLTPPYMPASWHHLLEAAGHHVLRALLLEKAKLKCYSHVSANAVKISNRTPIGILERMQGFLQWFPILPQILECAGKQCEFLPRGHQKRSFRDTPNQSRGWWAECYSQEQCECTIYTPCWAGTCSGTRGCWRSPWPQTTPHHNLLKQQGSVSSKWALATGKNLTIQLTKK